ncbi:ribosome biogenesis protein WDR12 homolog [Nilaparvata lugens]|uniref:ribosome biogenesis protein WDR12 homolog n=1 Tax=Nilaparvata lugens TaxID=108931 RepID=UPI00193DE831|nr:ribosome biogenesis protein WDR12 homolog [Nilaparvata lugens]
MASTSTYSSGTQIQIRFVTKQEKYSVPDTPFAVPCSIASDELNALLKELLNETSIDDSHKSVLFDFAISNVLLRQPLDKHVSEVGLSTENVIDIEYFEKFPSPEPEDCLMHDDWVSSVHVKGNWILSGCYDNNVYLWTKKGKHILTIPGHTGAVKSVAWVSQNDTIASFVSASHDQTAMLWEWNTGSNSVDCIHVCRGHERGLESIAVDQNAERFATGGWDSLLKVWSASLHRTDDNSLEESSNKKSKKTCSKSQTRTPLLTLKGHKEAISSVQWKTSSQLVTSSWDHTLKIWDVEYGSVATEISGNKTFFDCHCGPKTGYLITASADRTIRLYDPKSADGTLIKSSFLSHSEWVQTVRWSSSEENLFISGAYDKHVKLWDTRNCKVALYELLGHDEKVFCSDWSDAKYIVSGGADNTLRMYRTNKISQISDKKYDNDMV